MALTIRLDQDELEELETIQKHLGEATATKAIKKMIHQFMALKGHVGSQNIKIHVLQGEKQQYKASLRRMLDLQTEKELAEKEAWELVRR